jgi:single-stranded DNA-binding protein
LALREWEAKDGTKRQNLEVRVNDVTLLGGKKPAQSEAQPEARRQPAAAGTKPGFDDMDDDIPF